MLLTPPSLVVQHILNVICNYINCSSGNYPYPVSLLPEGFQANRSRNYNNYVVVENSGATSDVEKARFERKLSSDLPQSELLSHNEIENSDAGKKGSRPDPIVHTPQGSIEGYFMKVVSGEDIYAFEGIRYAEPPIGNLRFKAPVPIRAWNGTIQAMNPQSGCMQLYRGRLEGNEDCLRLSVFTPRIPHGDMKYKIPVIVFIHGGAFLFGKMSNYGPAYLSGETILVTLNYRLGVFGFFSTGDEVASGNWGLKDQALAIKWVYENIEHFGGDPSRIVLIGQSAGAVSVHLHMMSPLTQDKIFAGISMSGGAYNFWGFNTLEDAVQISKTQARIAFCPTDMGNLAMVECMRKISPSVLAANHIFTVGWRFPVPSVEPNVTGAFLSESPEEAYRNGHVSKIPWIATVTSQEANTVVAEIYARRALPLITRLFEAEGPIMLGLRGKISPEMEDFVMSEIKTFYGVGTGRHLRLPRKFFTDVFSARFFTTPFQKAVQMHSQIAPTYGGLFKYANNVSKSGQLGLDPKEFGVSHTDDIRFLFNSTSYPPIGRQESHFAVTKLLINIYQNFAELGIPAYRADDGYRYKFWEPVEVDQNFRLLQIDEEVMMIPNPFAETSEFWESLGLPDMTPYEKLDLVANKSVSIKMESKH